MVSGIYGIQFSLPDQSAPTAPEDIGCDIPFLRTKTVYQDVGVNDSKDHVLVESRKSAEPHVPQQTASKRNKILRVPGGGQACQVDRACTMRRQF